MTDSTSQPVSNGPVSNGPVSNRPEPGGSSATPSLQPAPEMRPLPNFSPIPAWRFWAVMLIQSALIVAVPFKSAVTYHTGQTVTLQTVPVDPYDLLRGYSQTLSFDISQEETLRSLPNAEAVLSEKATNPELYVTLEAPTAADQAASEVPLPWHPVAVSNDFPEGLADNQVALRGRYNGWQIEYGLETYYMPESQRDGINEHIREVQQPAVQLDELPEDAEAIADAFVVDVKIDRKGNSVPMSLWVDGFEYRF
ncbi:MAG: GDYXXLXY domain-containing protein [Cyanobacteria bacterium J06597_16]